MTGRVTYTVPAAARLLGVSRTYVGDAVRAGRLGAERVGRRYRITRLKLIAWMLRVGIEGSAARRDLNRGLERVLLVAPPPHLAAAFAGHRHAADLFEMGRAVEQESFRAAVVNLPALGTALACASLRCYHRTHDRPDLIGLYGEDGIPGGADLPFDLVLPATSPADRVRRVVRDLADPG